MGSTRAPGAPVPASFGDRVAGALWGLHIADALAMPSHWYYGGDRQVESHYGKITGYVKPRMELQGSIMALSNTGGAGRGGYDGDIIGSVIAHGKKQYWSRSKQYHYHCTLDRGENTLDCDLVRVCYKSLTDSNGELSVPDLLAKYVEFMTTPGNYNDCYVSTTHRMFFGNRERGFPLESCPDNDGHNVDTTCGLSMPVPVMLATAHLPAEKAHEEVNKCISMTRKSTECQEFGAVMADMLRAVLGGAPLLEVLERMAGPNIALSLKRQDPVVACYLNSNFPSVLHFAYKYGGDLEACLLANANCGGENVARGMVLGALVGATHGASNIPPHLKEGLKGSAGIAQDIDAFVAKVQPPAGVE